MDKKYEKMEKKGYFEDFANAHECVEKYLNFEESPFLKNFTTTLGIYDGEFWRYVQIISALDPALYFKFAIKYANNKNERKAITIERINNLYSGITTGSLVNGEPFDEIEFFKNLPFYDADTAQEILMDFDLKNASTLDQKLKKLLDAVKPESTRVITSYSYQNKLFSHTNAKTFKRSEIEKDSYYKDGVKLEDEDKKAILDYIEEENIPPLRVAFSILKNRFFDGKLQIDRGKVLKKTNN